ncbi:MAG: transketolase family protein [Deltaproteobacteria bacterium]|jgi:transketolase|nr:transketolase family protein [Deltaproteobacteria bacterium]MBW2535152.1 transketolase family protein [Deltaproteobacteria bacterium]
MTAPRAVYGKTLARLGETMDEIVVLDADLSKSTKTSYFAEAFPERFHDMGIAEQDMLSTAAGLATGGLTPFASTFAIFGTGRAWEQLRNSVCYPNLNVKLVATHGGITVGKDGGSHQSVEDLAVTRAIPNLRVIVPADCPETEQAIEAIAREPGPFYVRLPRGDAPDVHPPEWRFELGRATELRQGTDVALVGCGLMVAVALEAAAKLAEGGVSAAVVNVSTLKPLDVDTLARVAAATGAVVTLEEHSIIGGLGSAVCEALGERCPVPVERLGIADRFGQSGTADELLAHYGLTVGDAVARAEKVIARKAG